MNTDHPNEDEYKDPAHRLIILIKNIQKASKTTKNKNGEFAGNLPLHTSLDLIARSLSLRNYISLLKVYLEICSSIRTNIDIMPVKRDSVRTRAHKNIDHIEELFSSKNFEYRTIDIFKTYFDGHALDILDELSDRFQTANLLENSKETLLDSLDEARKLVDLCLNTNQLDEKTSLILKVTLNHLSNILKTYDDFGELDFWKSYRMLFSCFMELHDKVVNDDNKNEFHERMKSMLTKITLSTSLSANAVTLATPVIQYITNG